MDLGECALGQDLDGHFLFPQFLVCKMCEIKFLYTEGH